MIKKLFDAVGGPYVLAGALGVIAIGLAVSAGLGHMASHKRLSEERARTAAMTTVAGTVIHWGDVTCALVGTRYRAPGVPVGKWGEACQREVAALKAFHTDTLRKTNIALAEELQAQIERQQRDLAAARYDARVSREALAKLTEASANVQNDELGPEYFAAFNDAAGLRPSVGIEAAGDH